MAHAVEEPLEEVAAPLGMDHLGRIDSNTAE